MSKPLSILNAILCCTIMLLSLGLGLGLGSALAAEPKAEFKYDFHQNLLTIDSHVDIPDNFSTPIVDPGRRMRQQVDLVKMNEGGLDAAFFIVYVAQGPRNDAGYANAHRQAMNKFSAIHRMLTQYPQHIELAKTAEDIIRINNNGKKVALIGIENGYVIGKDLSLLTDYYNLGARYMTLTHFGHNDIGDSSNPSPMLSDVESEHKGLSVFGRQVVREMNRLGIMVDISHVSKQTMLMAVAESNAPVIASHSAISGVNANARNLDDEQLVAIKENNGVVQIVAVDDFLLAQPGKMWEEIHRLREEMCILDLEFLAVMDETVYYNYFERLRKEILPKWGRVGVKDFVDHIDYAVKKIGINHVGISSDFEGGGGVLGWDNAAETANITYELIARGYNHNEIIKLWGQNLMRVMADVEAAAMSEKL